MSDRLLGREQEGQASEKGLIWNDVLVDLYRSDW